MGAVLRVGDSGWDCERREDLTRGNWSEEDGNKRENKGEKEINPNKRGE